MRCAKEVGLPVNNMLDGIAGQMGITPEQIESMEDSMNQMMAAPSESDGIEDGGAPAIDMPSLFGEGGLGGLFGDMAPMGENMPAPHDPHAGKGKEKGNKGKAAALSAKPKARLTAAEREKLIEQLTAEMKEAARKLEFEQAAFLRDRIKALKE